MNSLNPADGAYSARGSTLAKEALGKDGFFKSSRARIDEFEHGLSEIEQSSETTDAEKTLAQLRVKVAGEGMSEKTRATAMKILLNTVATPFPSPLGCAVAEVLTTIASQVKDSDERRSIIEAGLAQLKQAPYTGSDEKVLARFGGKILDSGCDNSITDAAMVVTTALSSPLSGPISRIVADISLKAAKKSGDPESKHKIVTAGLNETIADQKSTPEEKELAALGKIFGDKASGYDEMARATGVVAGILSQPITGPVTQAIARASLDAAAACRDSENRHKILKAGLERIRNHPQSTGEEIELAALGEIIWQKTSGNEEMARATGVVTGILSQPFTVPVTQTIARASLDAAGACTDAENRHKLMRAGLERIRNHPQSSPQEKELAALGEIIWQKTSGNEEMAKTTEVVAKTLSADITGPITEVIAQTALNAARACTDSENRHRINKVAFEELLTHPSSTPEQQIIAQFGKDLWDVISGNDSMARATGVAVEALTKPITDPFVKVIADISLAVSGKSRDDEENYRILGKGLERIQKSRASDEQKALAEYGITVGNQTSGYGPGAQAMEKIFSLINTPESGPVWRTIARTAPAVASAVRDPEESCKSLRAAFIYLQGKAAMPPEVKDIARKALQAASDAPDTPAASAVLLDFLKQMETLKTRFDLAKEELEQMKENLQKPPESSLIIEEDEFVNINGVRLDVKK